MRRTGLIREGWVVSIVQTHKINWNVTELKGPFYWSNKSFSKVQLGFAPAQVKGCDFVLCGWYCLYHLTHSAFVWWSLEAKVLLNWAFLFRFYFGQIEVILRQMSLRINIYTPDFLQLMSQVLLLSPACVVIHFIHFYSLCWAKASLVWSLAPMHTLLLEIPMLHRWFVLWITAQ